MTNERLEQLKKRVEQADLLANDIDVLKKNCLESELENMSWKLRDELFRVGRQALLKNKEAELESMLADSKPEAADVATSAEIQEATVCCESMAQYGRCNA